MRLALLRLATLLLLLVPLSSANAAFKFGDEEDIRFIQDVTLKGTQQEALYLGHMTKTHYFLLGLYPEDAGYVLGVKGQSGRYYHMPGAEDVARFQQGGVLPNPLPPYKLGFLDYMVGYSLWWGLALVVLVSLFGWMRKKKAPPVSPDAAPPASSASA
jgi:hypothetical protein